MPNWVYNGLTVEGSPDSINKMVEQLNSPFHLVHDNWDSETMEYKKKDTLYPNPVFAFWNIVKPTDIEAYQSQPKHDPNASIADMMKHEGDDWYNFNNREWGVKWDVAISSDEKYPETYMEGPVENGDNLVIYYNFNTAWTFPDAALINLSSQYPDLLFTLSYEEETGWGGEHEYLRGKCLEGSQYGWKCKECDHMEEDTPFCDECDFDMCPSCGWGEPRDEDRAQCQTHMIQSDTNPIKENA